MTSKSRNRNRRLRKKLRVGEFQEFGFDISFSLRPELPEADTIRFWDEFILEAIENHSLAFGGGTEGFVTAWGRGTTTDTHREIVRAWLTSRPEVVSAQAGPLVDAWQLPEDGAEL